MEQLRLGYKIREVAGSPVLTIPRHMLRKLSLAIGDVVTLSVDVRGRLIIEPMQVTKPTTKGKSK